MRTRPRIPAVAYLRRTALRKRLRELERNNALFQMALQDAPVILFTQDRDLRYTWIYNPAGAYTSEAVIGKTDAELVAPGDVGVLTTIKRRVLETGARTREQIYLERSGDSAYYDLMIEPIVDAHGQIAGISAVAVDVTAQRRRDNELQQSQAHFRRLVESSVVGILIGEQERITFANDAFLRLLGYNRAEIEDGRVSWQAITPPEYAELDRRAVEQLYELGECEPFEKEYIRRDGTRLPILIGAATLSREPFHWVAFVLDNTARKQLLDHEQAARHEAEGVLRMRDEFLALAAHELKAPLTVLLGLSDLLLSRARREQSLNQRDTQTVATMKHQAQRLNGLIESLLDIARIQTGRISIERQLLDLGELLDRLAEETRELVAPQHSIMFDRAPGPCILVGDATRLEQVFHNLLGNAVKYSPPGKPITMRLVRGCGWAEVAVIDEGIGIPPEAHERLFQQFYRAPNVQGVPGIGVGLFVAKQILNLHGGDISVSSAEGCGSTFTVRLPLEPETV
jgi:PAS domain S-box-containing protein